MRKQDPIIASIEVKFSWHAHGMYGFRPMCSGRQIPVSDAHFESKKKKKKKTARCACDFREKFTFCTGSWPSQIVHFMHSHVKYFVQHVLENACSSCGVCNTIRRPISNRLWLVLRTSHTRLESPSSGTCYTIYCFVTHARNVRFSTHV